MFDLLKTSTKISAPYSIHRFNEPLFIFKLFYFQICFETWFNYFQWFKTLIKIQSAERTNTSCNFFSLVYSHLMYMLLRLQVSMKVKSDRYFLSTFSWDAVSAFKYLTFTACQVGNTNWSGVCYEYLLTSNQVPVDKQ